LPPTRAVAIKALEAAARHKSFTFAAKVLLID
jgi:hypothetical protein